MDLLEDDGQEPVSFGLVDGDGRATAIWRSGVLLGHGERSAFGRFNRAYGMWTDHGLPELRSGWLAVVKAGCHVGEDGRIWIERIRPVRAAYPDR